MATFSVDRSVEFFLDDGVADDEAFRTSLGVDSYVRVHSEHVLAKYKGAMVFSQLEELLSSDAASAYSGMLQADTRWGLVWRRLPLHRRGHRPWGLIVPPPLVGLVREVLSTLTLLVLYLLTTLWLKRRKGNPV